MADPARKSVVERLTQKTKDTLSSGMEQALQYGKDVATGKKLLEGLSQNDGYIIDRIAHGSSEFVNILMKGEAAPLYARSQASPTNHQSDPGLGNDAGVHGQQQDRAQEMAAPSRQNETGVHGPQNDAASQHQFRSSVGQLCQECEANLDAPEMQRRMSH